MAVAALLDSNKKYSEKEELRIRSLFWNRITNIMNSESRIPTLVIEEFLKMSPREQEKILMKGFREVFDIPPK